MLHPGPLLGDGVIAAVEPGASAALDLLADVDRPHHAFLRTAWFAAGRIGAPICSLVARRPGSDDPLVAIPLIQRRFGPFAISEVAGPYWPWRSFPLAPNDGREALAALLSSRETGSRLGRIWRLGPVLEDDPGLAALAEVAAGSGWSLITRRLGTCYRVEFAKLRESGPWPTTKTKRKNRWLERRLAESGPVSIRSISGTAWSKQTFAALARIESESWVGRSADRRDTKFLDPANRSMWTGAIKDPVLADLIGASILEVGGEPAAFTFHVRSGATLHMIANSFSERFREGSPGRLLLYHDLEKAAEAGIEAIGWGIGDPGYKTEMGAVPGAELVDLLVVRGPLVAALVGPLWRRRP